METNTTQQNTTQPQNQFPPKTWLVESILVTLLCCLPFGIVGIIKASKVESLFMMGDIEGANRASKEAKKWTLIGVGVSAGFALLYFLFIIVFIIIAASQN